jgi:glycosyltransferase involved in cell wall biosynthesis
MKVSVVVCTYAPEMYGDFLDAVESVRAQTYDDVELVVVVDGDDEVCERVRVDVTGDDEVAVCNAENVGLSASRNRGAAAASGDVVAFMDDDAVADEQWVERLVDAYEDGARAAGGRMAPLWVDGRPSFLPEEFYWLVGVTHRGFADGPGEVRNTFGSNISFDAETFRELGGFDPDLGLSASGKVQGEETELATRMHREYGDRVQYRPDAVVAHKVFDYRTDPRWLLERAFWQGYSKRAMETILDDDAGGAETTFLRQLLTRFVPGRARSLVTGPSVAGLLQFVMLFVFTSAVGLGYLYGLREW